MEWPLTIRVDLKVAVANVVSGLDSLSSKASKSWLLAIKVLRTSNPKTSAEEYNLIFMVLVV
jgi:hypothetical protein